MTAMPERASSYHVYFFFLHITITHVYLGHISISFHPNVWMVDPVPTSRFLKIAS